MILSSKKIKSIGPLAFHRQNLTKVSYCLTRNPIDDEDSPLQRIGQDDLFWMQCGVSRAERTAWPKWRGHRATDLEPVIRATADCSKNFAYFRFSVFFVPRNDLDHECPAFLPIVRENREIENVQLFYRVSGGNVRNLHFSKWTPFCTWKASIFGPRLAGRDQYQTTAATAKFMWAI